MIKVSIITILFMFYASHNYKSVQAHYCNVQGYYWRDYTGEVPLDALPGGSDINGKPIYIGQVFTVQHHLLPGKIYANKPVCYYGYGDKEYEVTEFIKIFCTQYPEHFEWIKTNNDGIQFLTRKHLIIGGYRPESTIYIGRIRENGEVTVGKVIANSEPRFNGLYVTKDGIAKRHTSFEILIYNSSLIPQDIDARIY